MGIVYDEEQKVFGLHTKSSTYLCGLTEDGNYLGHIYYGKRMKDLAVSYLLRTDELPFTPETNLREKASFRDVFHRNIRQQGLETTGKRHWQSGRRVDIVPVNYIMRNMKYERENQN